MMLLWLWMQDSVQERNVHTRAVFALKTNILEWATITPNLGAEVTLAPKWSLELAGSINPFKFSDNNEMETLSRYFGSTLLV